MMAEETPVLKEKKKKVTHPLTQNVTLGSKTKKARKKKNSKTCESENSEDENAVDLNLLSVHTLRKYRKYYSLPIASNLHKTELVREINKHFTKMDLEPEKTIITYFIHFAKDEGTEAEKVDENIKAEQPQQ